MSHISGLLESGLAERTTGRGRPNEYVSEELHSVMLARPPLKAGDLREPNSYRACYKLGFQVYLQIGSEWLPLSYDLYLPNAGQALARGGYSITDDHVRGGERKGNSLALLNRHALFEEVGFSEKARTYLEAIPDVGIRTIWDLSIRRKMG